MSDMESLSSAEQKRRTKKEKVGFYSDISNSGRGVH
jgi:hypothetical protein